MVRVCLCVGRTKYASKPEKWHSEGKLCDRTNKGVGLRATLPICGNSQCMGAPLGPGCLATRPLPRYVIEVSANGLKDWLKSRTVGLCMAFNRLACLDFRRPCLPGHPRRACTRARILALLIRSERKTPTRLLNFRVVRSTRPCQFVPSSFIGKNEFRNQRDPGHSGGGASDRNLVPLSACVFYWGVFTSSSGGVGWCLCASPRHQRRMPDYPDPKETFFSGERDVFSPPPFHVFRHALGAHH